MKITKMRVKGWVVAALAVLSLGATALPGSASATTPISQGFLIKGNPPIGSIVSLQNNSSDYVNTSTPGNVNNMLGVIVGGDSLLSLSTSQGAHQVQVATSGLVQILVSNINGSISTGSQVTASPISGVGMLATNNVKVIGVAQGSLTDNNGSKETYKDKNGQQHSVLIGQVPVLISVAYFYKQPDKTIIPSAIQNLADALAGKSVNSLPILISMAIFIITLIVVVSMIYSMIHSSIISVGRNPMSQAAIYRDLIQLSTLVLIILGVAFVAIYMVLTRL